MEPLVPPFVANDRGDVYIYDDEETMYSDIEALSAEKINFFDGAGRPVPIVVEGNSWHLNPDRAGSPDEDHLRSILRSYFARLPDGLATYADRAKAASTLDELVRLRQDLALEPRPNRWGRLFRRTWG